MVSSWVSKYCSLQCAAFDMKTKIKVLVSDSITCLWGLAHGVIFLLIEIRVLTLSAVMRSLGDIYQLFRAASFLRTCFGHDAHTSCKVSPDIR